MNYLHKFYSLLDFLDFSKRVYDTGWRIENQLLRDRVEKHRKNSFFVDIKKRFLSRELSIWELKDEEVITWLDTIDIFSRVLRGIYSRESRIETVVFMEYLIPYGNHMRCDYLMVFGNTIITIEFGMFNQDEKRGEERYSKKLLETIAYRQIIQNQVSDNIKVNNYVLIYKPEFNRVSEKYLDENIKYNNNEVIKMTNYILQSMNKEIESLAINQLSKIV